jgi:hypothetical protein
MSDNENDIKPKPKSVGYYLKIIQKGDANEWQKLFNECRNDYDVAFNVALAIGKLKPELGTIKQMWKNSIEYLQPGISIKLGNEADEDLKIRDLKKQKYS